MQEQLKSLTEVTVVVVFVGVIAVVFVVVVVNIHLIRLLTQLPAFILTQTPHYSCTLTSPHRLPYLSHLCGSFIQLICSALSFCMYNHSEGQSFFVLHFV